MQACMILMAVLAVGQLQPAQAWWLFSDSSAVSSTAKPATGAPVYGPSPKQVLESSPVSAPASSAASASASSSASAPVPAPPTKSTPTSAPAAKAASPSTSTAKKALAEFDMDGVKGVFRFSQASNSQATVCEYDLQGLKGNNKMYHVHVKPVPKFDAGQVRNNATAMAALCSAEATGGHLNPFNVTQKIPPQSAPFDQYEVGDLSGKHGPLKAMTHPGHEDHYVGSFKDDKLSLSGEHGIIGRSIVIHKNEGGKRWVCATINEVN